LELSERLCLWLGEFIMLRIPLSLTLILFLADIAPGQDQVAAPAKQAPQATPTERGRYLVHHVAMCVICHTPKTSEGELITTQLLRGSPMPVASPYPKQMWAARAPAIAGLGGFSEADLVMLLQTGSRPNGDTPALPMPPFRMTEEDARAVAAYLKSLR
jgi:mono/diheme cytochrome c family protein